MAQLEDELAGQQRQLDTMRKTLSNVVDVATHRMHKDHVVEQLANKADLGLLERQYVDLIEVRHEQLSEALSTKADARAIAQCQRDIWNVSQAGAALEDQHEQLLRAVEDERVSLKDLQSHQERLGNVTRAELESLELHQKVLEAALADKADVRLLEEQERRISRTETFAQQLERTSAEAAQEQLSATLSTGMSNQVLCQASEDALKVERKRLDATQAELASLENLVGELQSAQSESKQDASANQEKWYKEKDHEQYLLAVARKGRQDQHLVQALAKKADVAWYEQHKAVIDDVQVSLTALNRQVCSGQKDLQMQLMDKVDAIMLEKQQKRLQQDMTKAREDTADVAQKLEKHSASLDMVRGQLLEMTRQLREVEATLSVKVDKAALERRDDQLDALRAAVEVLEGREDATERKFGRLQEQLHHAGRSSVAGDLCSSGEQYLFSQRRPPSSPREPHRRSPHRAKTPGCDSPYKCKPKFVCS